MNRNPYESLIAWFASNSVAANLLMVVLLLGGAWTAFNIKKDIFPQIEIDMVTVSVTYRGAAPGEVEEGVCLKIEDAIENIEGIEQITCQAREGVGVVNAEIEKGYDVLEALDEIKLRVDGIATFPAETEKPVITRAQMEQEVLWVSVSGDVDEPTLKEFTRQMRDELVALPEVTRADIIGARAYEIGIEVSEHTLQQYDLTFDEVARAVRANSLDLPGGRLQTDGGDILLRTTGQAYAGREFEQIVVRTNPDGSQVTVGDLATVNDGFVETDRYSKFNENPAISIRVMGVGEQSVIDISAAVRTYIDQRQAGLPDGVSVGYWADSSYYLQTRLEMMNRNLISGAVLVFLLLALFLRLKLAFWVMVGLPVAFLGTMLLLPVFGITINMLSLFAFILVLGIVVDDAIVMGESAYTSIREHGHSEQSVVDGVLKVATPATFGVLTTAVAFLPILMISGVFGQFFSAIGVVVILCLVFSLVESKLILPAHLAHMKVTRYRDLNETRNPLKRISRKMVGIQRGFSEGMRHFVKRFYLPALRVALRERYITLAGFIAALILSIGIVGSGLVRVVFFPDFSAEFIQAQLEMTEGTNAEITHGHLDYMHDKLKEVDAELAQRYDLKPGEIVPVVSLWSNSQIGGQVMGELVKEEVAVVSTKEVQDLWREKVGDIPGAKQLTMGGVGGPEAGPSIAFQLVGRDIDSLAAAAADLKRAIGEYDGVHDLRNTFEGGAREIKLDLKPAAVPLGLTLQDLARQVRQGFFGEEVQRIQRGQDDVRVMLRYPIAERSSVGDLESMRIRTADGSTVPFSAVATIDTSFGPTTIRRVDRERAVVVSAEVDKARVEPGKINAELRQQLPNILAKYPGVRSKLDGGAAEQQEVAGEMLVGALVALFLIYALMAVALRSYVQPLLIMSVIPFGFIGAVLGHWLLGLTLSMLSFFGIIALSGVVVNDSLILVDFVNRAKRTGTPVMEAVIDGASQRFRAIILTSVTTFLGLAPIIFFEASFQAKVLVPMATSLGFGILFATAITLFLIPVLYHVWEDVRVLLRRFVNWLFDRDASDGTDGSGQAVDKPN